MKFYLPAAAEIPILFSRDVHRSRRRLCRLTFLEESQEARLGRRRRKERLSD